MEAVAAVLGTDLGLKINLYLLRDSAEETQKLGRGDFDFALHTPALSIDDPSDGYVNRVATGTAFNYGKYSNPQVDQLLRKQDRELDSANRRALLWQAQRIHLTEFPSVPFIDPGSVSGVRPEVKNFHHRPVSVHTAFGLEDVWLDR